jgi:hypothetical protein
LIQIAELLDTCLAADAFVVDDEPVPSHFSDPPRWLRVAFAGLVGGAGTGLLIKTDGVSWTTSGVVAVIGGIVFALAIWRFEPKWRRERAEIEGGLPADKLRLARRAAERGPVPDDPEIRAAALRIASRDLNGSPWHPGPKAATAMGVAMAIASVVAAFSGSWRALPYALSACAMFYYGLYRPKQLRRRIELLTAPENTPAG